MPGYIVVVCRMSAVYLSAHPSALLPGGVPPSTTYVPILFYLSSYSANIGHLRDIIVTHTNINTWNQYFGHWTFILKTLVCVLLLLPSDMQGPLWSIVAY